jgi:hypothetical protein
MRNLYSDEAISPLLAPALTGIFSQCAIAHIEWRDRHPEVPVLDLSYKEINEDGMSAARRIYEFLDMPLSTDAERAMQRWQQDNGKDKHGKNIYSNEDLGIPEGEMRRLFAPYLDRYAAYL